MKRPTIKDIAQECGVSLSTVSLVLNNNPRISEKTREKVLAAVEKHGYQPDTNARGLASKSSRCLSVVVPDLNHVFADVYFGEIVSGIYDTASEQGNKVMLDVANERFIESKEYINILRSRWCDGMLFIASSMDDQYLLDFEETDYPFLLVNHHFPGSSLDYIVVDYVESAHQAAAHLLELGHKKIGIIAGTNTYSGLDFRDAFIATCHKGGLQTKDMPSTDGNWNQEGGFQAAEKLLTERPDLTAIMAGNDMMAIGAMRYIHKQGKDVPGDISVMGVDDIPTAAFTIPGLSTIRHDLYEIGRTACERLLQLFREEIKVCHEVLPAKLVVRESTGPAKS